VSLQEHYTILYIHYICFNYISGITNNSSVKQMSYFH